VICPQGRVNFVASCGGRRGLGAPSISGPTNGLKGELLNDELPEMLPGALNEVEISLKYARNPAG